MVTCTNGSNQNQQILDAATVGNLKIIEKLLECNDTNINAQDDDNRTSLYLATLKNHTDVVKFILGIKNVDVNLGAADTGETALILAAKCGSYDVVRLLLDNDKIDVNKGLLTTGLNALIVASQNGHSEIVQILIAHPDILVNDALLTTGANPLTASLKNGYDDITNLLLQKTEVDVNQGLKNGRSPLIIASSNANSSASQVRMLLSKPGIEVNKALFDGQTALFFAVTSGNFDVVELLLRCPKVDPELLDEEYKTAEDYATENEMDDIVKSFDERGTITKEKGHSCCSDKINRGLLLAVEGGDLTWVKTFLPCPQIDINIGNQYGITPLQEAARDGYNEITRLLLSNFKIETNKDNSVNGKTALIYAAEEGKWEVVKMLLSNAQINVEISDIKGESALQKAVSRGHLMVVKLLLRCSKTNVEYIVTENDDIREAIMLRADLLQVGPTCCLNVDEGLLKAGYKGYFREIRGLLQCPESNINVIDRGGRTPLYLASLNGHYMAVQVLLEDKSIDVNIGKALDGGTAFSIASQKKVDGHFEVMRQLISYGNTNGKSVLNKGWCRDNWTPQIIICPEINELELSMTTTATSTSTAGK